jgi:hypothetical protein
MPPVALLPPVPLLPPLALPPWLCPALATPPVWLALPESSFEPLPHANTAPPASTAATLAV